MHGEDRISKPQSTAPTESGCDAANGDDIADLRRQLDEAHKVMWALYKELDDKNAALNESNAELDQFATIAGHDLQEPLRKVLAFGRMLTDEHGDALGGGGRDYLDRMQGASERMLELIGDLVRYARVTSQAKSFEPTDLADLVDSVVSDLGEQIRREKGTVEVGSLPKLVVDTVQMRQLFQNLISNALKFHHPDRRPVVKVAAQALEDGTTQLTVSDNGIGFKSKFATRVFEPFRRLHGQGKYEGTGMGLAIVRKIARRHGGDVEVLSEPDAGSTFVVTLPDREHVVAAELLNAGRSENVG